MRIAFYDWVRTSLWKLSLCRATAFISFFISIVFYWITRKENILKKGLLNNKWDDLPESDIYYVYFNFATFPMLYTIPHMLTHDKPSFLWCQRNRSINADYIPEHVNYLSKTPLSLISAQFVLNRLVKNFKKQISINQNAKIIMFVGSEMKYINGIHPFIKHCVPEENYKIIIADCGWSYFNGFEEYMSNKNNWLEGLEKAKQQFASIKRSYLPFIPAISMPNVYFPAFCSSIMSNVEYWFPNVDYIPETIEELKIERERMVIKNTCPIDLFNELSESNKKVYSNLMEIDMEYYSKLFYSSSIPNLIITDSLCCVNEGRFHLVGEKIVKEYADDYNLYYKPHPTMPYVYTSPETEDFLEKNNIIKLPPDLPLEIILMMFPDAFVGGYKSAIYLTIMDCRVKFFITRNMFVKTRDVSGFHNPGAFYDIYKLIETLYESGAYKDAKLFWV